MAPRASRLEQSGWTCPVCGRQFKQPTVEHTCQLFTLAHHYTGKPDEVVQLCETYLAAARELGPDVSIEPLKTAIMLRTRTNFGSVRLTRSGMHCWLTLTGLPDDLRITKSMRYTSRKLAVAFNLKEAAELDAEVLKWLGEAYTLAL